MIVYFPSDNGATLAEVGGKGLSLIQGAQNGLPVPPGFILSVAFFSPWFAALKHDDAWKKFIVADSVALKGACEDLTRAGLQVNFSEKQKQDLDAAFLNIEWEGLCAVRSSSPEEDLEGASFAGGYETILGVTRKTLEGAIKRAFVSCLDYRVVVYKKNKHFDIHDPKIAVVIQKQIASEVAGIGFSLNPVTNNYDEAVVNANWGLGESVVAGRATPDTFVVDTAQREIIRKTLGTKETSIWLQHDGGTQERADARAHDVTLTDAQILELAALIKHVEEIYHKPMDIEWAFSSGTLYLLQARPITAYVPLSPELMTAPGAKKRLYLDLTLAVQGLDKPLSPMATSIFRKVFGYISSEVLRVDLLASIDSALPWLSDGRLYLNISNAFEVAGQKRIVSALSKLDSLSGQTLAALDEQDYRARGSGAKRIARHAALALLCAVPRIARAGFYPTRAEAAFRAACADFERDARQLYERETDINRFTERIISRLFDTVFRQAIPIIVVGRIAAFWGITKLVNNPEDDDQRALDCALPNNLTTQMGLDLYEAARVLPEDADKNTLLSRIRSGTMPEEFTRAWETFLQRYGHRGPGELDIAAPRYRDNPQLLVELMVSLRHTKGETPHEKFNRGRKAREEASKRLEEKLKRRSACAAWTFRSLYEVGIQLAGFRETPKFYLIYAVDLIRQKILKEAQNMCRAGRLDTPEHVFDLSLEELTRAISDPRLDLRALSRRNRVFINKLARAPRLPTIIDSRGVIPRPPKPLVKEGEVAGAPISVGVVRGAIKILHSPDEKPLQKGEILVARATDPGWTPLFVNAGGLILEVGGILQHGALVAREYGLPCVAGVESATTLWRDGDLVELDGGAGTIRLIKGPVMETPA